MESNWNPLGFNEASDHGGSDSALGRTTVGSLCKEAH